MAIYAEGNLKASFVYKTFDKSKLKPLFDVYSLDKGIYSTVADVDEDLIAYLKECLSCFIYFDNDVRLPITIKYKTPHTLGKDRIAAVVGAYYLQPNRNILIIDAGTCITYELLEASGSYLGGNISPGMTTRFKALNDYTKKLPLVNEREEVPCWGTCTEDAIRAGVVNGIVFEMDGYIDKAKELYSDVLVFLTGGHSFYFESRLKNFIFADINLVLTGLNRILEYNVEN
ncbi:type III pantothenate kinase [Parabacteroides sp. AGMB00274]|uniref:Type III pantothenate kinase n=1 Tax=Parabacteroides faecalis TaxID=2924040 RepID=A0ABT0BYB2_9BACT|nr:type III pantothenate kinase [Parabacteroides faecalis]